MFNIAFLQHNGQHRLRDEEQRLHDDLTRRGIPIEFYTLKRIQRRDLPLTRTSFIAGDMDAMHGAMKQLGIEIPPANDYPKCLQPFMHRKVWMSTLGTIEQMAWDMGLAPVFVKPAARRKNFTGFVVASASDLYRLGGTSRRQPVWCSEVVKWVSEFRVYVVRDRIVSIDHYDGDPQRTLDLDVVAAALAAFRAAGEAPSAYGIDFGVLSSGQTALVEANDGYALGAYAIAAEPYTDLVLQRWSELVSSLP
jgi:hypothetical protein